MCDIDFNDAITKWWSQKDTKKALGKRFADFWNTMHYTDFQTAIVAGHSLFFRELCRTFLSAAFRENNPEFAAKLHKYKMGNGACLCIDVDFTGNKPQVTHAELMFGTSLHERHTKRDQLEEKMAKQQQEA